MDPVLDLSNEIPEASTRLVKFPSGNMYPFRARLTLREQLRLERIQPRLVRMFDNADKDDDITDEELASLRRMLERMVSSLLVGVPDDEVAGLSDTGLMAVIRAWQPPQLGADSVPPTTAATNGATPGAARGRKASTS